MEIWVMDSDICEECGGLFGDFGICLDCGWDGLGDGDFEDEDYFWYED
jgi:hypothetical protein